MARTGVRPWPASTVLITGAARGIGAALARKAAARGARVALVGLEPELLAAVADELGPEHLWVEADVTDAEALKAAVAAHRRHLRRPRHRRRQRRHRAADHGVSPPRRTRCRAPSRST